MKRQGKTIHSEALRITRERYKELDEAFKSEMKQRKEAEQYSARCSLEFVSYRTGLAAAVTAIDALARAVSKTTTAGRKARDEARRALAVAGIRPPGSLGSLRKVTKKRKRRKKVLKRAP